jgi:uncharacterized protein YbdZ (MbtH family)
VQGVGDSEGRKPMIEYESALRRAFVDHRADCIVITSRRQQFQIESANYGIDQGWLTGKLDESDEQSASYVCRSTEKGREHFGL